GAGTSIDQLIAKKLRDDAIAGGLSAGAGLSVVWGLNSNGNSAFLSGPGKHIPPETNPTRAWQTLFGAGFVPVASGPDAMKRAAAILKRKQSMFDFAITDCKNLKDRLGAEGGRLLDEHCSTLRSTELSLSSVGVDAGKCVKPVDP